MAEIQLEMVSLSNAVYSGYVHHITVPAYQGDMEIYHGHRAIVALLKPGQVKLSFTDREPVFYYVSGGVLEVYNSVVCVLADNIIHAKDIDEAATLLDQERLEQSINNQQADHGYSKMLTKMTQARAKLRAARNYNALPSNRHHN